MTKREFNTLRRRMRTCKYYSIEIDLNDLEGLFSVADKAIDSLAMLKHKLKVGLATLKEDLENVYD